MGAAYGKGEQRFWIASGFDQNLFADLATFVEFALVALGQRFGESSLLVDRAGHIIFDFDHDGHGFGVSQDSCSFEWRDQGGLHQVEQPGVDQRRQHEAVRSVEFPGAHGHGRIVFCASGRAMTGIDTADHDQWVDEDALTGFFDARLLQNRR